MEEAKGFEWAVEHTSPSTALADRIHSLYPDYQSLDEVVYSCAAAVHGADSLSKDDHAEKEAAVDRSQD